jgi:hypothetical protein
MTWDVKAIFEAQSTTESETGLFAALVEQRVNRQSTNRLHVGSANTARKALSRNEV